MAHGGADGVSFGSHGRPARPAAECSHRGGGPGTAAGGTGALIPSGRRESAFTCEVYRDEDGSDVLLVLTGQLDVVAAGELDRRLSGAEAQKPALIVLDLRGLTFMDSSGFVSLLRADLRRRESGGDLMIVRGGREITRIFEVSDPGRRLPLVDGVPSARWIVAAARPA